MFSLVNLSSCDYHTRDIDTIKVHVYDILTYI